MNGLIGIVIVWLVTAASLLIISKLPTGVEIDSFKKALIASAVFGLVNAIVGPIIRGLFVIPSALTLFLLSFVFMAIANAIVFGLAAWLVDGFRLRWGFWSALIGAVLLGFINSAIFNFLGIAR